MKKLYFLFMLLVLIVTVVGIVSAEVTTVIGGNISNADFTRPVGGATVEVTCDVNTNTTTSQNDGYYAVTFDPRFCSEGNYLSVRANKTGVGENTVIGNIHDNVNVDLNLGIVNVPLVPEFGFFVGLTTVFGALGLFFYVRKK